MHVNYQQHFILNCRTKGTNCLLFVCLNLKDVYFLFTELSRRKTKSHIVRLLYEWQKVPKLDEAKTMLYDVVSDSQTQTPLGI